MYGLLLSLMMGQVAYGLIDEKPANYSLTDPIKQVELPKFTRQSKKSWYYKSNETKEQLIEHLKTNKNHKNTFKDVDIDDLSLETLKNLHGLDHENSLTNKDLHSYSFETLSKKQLNNFKSNCTTYNTRKKRILYFTADWCPACKSCYNQYYPWLSASRWIIGTGSDSHIQIVNIDKQPDMMRRYGVASIPTFIVIDDEKVIKRTGYLQKEQIPNLLK